MKKQPVYLKFTNSDETHNEFTFKTGLNTDTNPFDPDPTHECGPYGLYFTDAMNWDKWIDGKYVREVTLPKGERKVTLDDKYRAHRIILGRRHDLSKVAAWKWMVSKGIDITTDDSYTICWASRCGHLDVVKYLVSKGADVTAWDNFAVCLASKYGHLDVVKYLVSKGADVTARDNAAVRLASDHGHLDVVKFLVSQGADVSAADNYAIRWASMHGHLDIVKYLKRIAFSRNHPILYRIMHVFTTN